MQNSAAFVKDRSRNTRLQASLSQDDFLFAPEDEYMKLQPTRVQFQACVCLFLNVHRHEGRLGSARQQAS